MTITVDSGVTSGPITISAADPLVVLDGGEVYSATILNGASATLSSGGIGSDLTVSKGGVVLGSGELEGDSFIYGLVSRGTVNGALELKSGGEALGVTVSGGGIAIDAGGTLADFRLDADGVTAISSGAKAVNGVVESGGVLMLSAGGTATNVTVEAGGLFVFGGNLSADFTYLYGANPTAVIGGVTVSGGAGLEFEGATVLSGVTLSLGSGTDVDALTIAKGGQLLGPGQLGGVNRISGSVSSAAVTDGGVIDLVSGAATAVTVSDGTVEVEAGSTAAGTVISSGGRQIVGSGGADRATVVRSAGRDYVSSGGQSEGAFVSSGGGQVVLVSGLATDTVVSGGGAVVISSGGLAIGLTVLAGGEVVDDGQVRIAGAGTLDGALEGSGAIVRTETGDLVIGGEGTAFSGKLAIEGGTIELATSGAIGTGYVAFAEPATGSAVLQIDAADAPAAGGTFANKIEDFSGANEEIDLRSIAYVAGASAHVLGSTLVLTDGGKTYSFNIAAAASAFEVLNDGHGGTLIDPRVAALSHAMATFRSPEAAASAPIARTSSSAETPFLHATNSVSAGHQ